jgi:hypothetical protein
VRARGIRPFEPVGEHGGPLRQREDEDEIEEALQIRDPDLFLERRP